MSERPYALPCSVATGYDTTVFTSNPLDFLWSSTVDATSGNPWFLATREGGVSFADAITDAGVRCVR